MRSKNMKRIGAALLAAIMTFQCAGGAVPAEAANVLRTTASNTQMSSEKEVVYVNNYSTTEREQNFDENWKFYLGSVSGADQVNFDDSSWRNVSLPHDYSIEQEYTASGEAESAYLPGGTGWYRKHFVVGSELEGKEVRIDFGGVYMNATVWVNGEQLGTHPYGYTPFSFDITDYVNYGETNVITVKVDHQTPSSRWYSGSGIYRSVNLTVTDPVHVDLYGTQITTPNLETEKGGTVNMTVKTTVANAGDAAAEVVLVHTIYEKDTETSIGTVTTEAASVAAGAATDITATLQAANPTLWSVDTYTPQLYTVKTEVKVGENVVDTYETEYGFRYFSFNNNTGFTLNGEKLKLKGVCMHHDQGSLGSEAHYAAVKRQMKIMKDMGANAIRVTHNPASDELIEACNEIGLLVIEEAFDGWSKAKNGNSNDYSVWFESAIEDGNEIIGAEDDMTWAEFDIKAMVNRGKNSPAIIMWSLGNEITEGTNSDSQPTYPSIANSLIEWVEEIDTTRPTTIGDNKAQGLNNSTMLSVDANIHAAGGIVGTNYADNSEYDNIHNTYPEWILYGAETASHVNSRGEYDVIGSQELNSDKALTSYDYSSVGWGATASAAWYDVITRDFVAGEFVWTGFDYLGEPTPRNGIYSGAQGSWPSPKNSYFGIVDTAGLPKDNYYFYHSQWNEEENTLHVLPAWNSDVVYKGNSNGVPVVVYSDAASVELFFTGTDGERESLGKKTFTTKTTAAGFSYQIYEGTDKESTTNRNLYFTWYVPYEDGTITAVAYDAEDHVITDTVGRSAVTTTGDEAKLSATVDRDTISADGKDLAYITVDVKDADGNIVPDASNQVTFSVQGDGVLVGVDNGKQADHQSFQDNNRAAYNGSLVAIVQATKEAGSFTVTATASGLTPASVSVTTEAVEDNAAAEVQMSSFYMAKNYYVKAGSAPVLPTTIETRYTDGSSEELEVVWDEIAADNYAQAGVFSVNGIVDELYSVSVTVYMLDEIGGLLNYSTWTSTGKAPVLPDSRPAVSIDGEILDVSFPVVWDDIDAEDYAQAGTFTVKGSANVLGEDIEVTTSVRVQAETITIGDNIAPSRLRLTQDIQADKQSDTLEAIIDGSTAIGNNTDGGPNETIWSNYDNSDPDNGNDNTAELVFEYATQQRLGEIVIHFGQDGWSAAYPDAGMTEIWISETGADDSWTQIVTEETIGTESDNVKPYTYTFQPTMATFVKFVLKNSTTANKSSGFTCTSISEIEIKLANGSYGDAGSSAEVDKLSINHIARLADEIAEGVCYVEEETAVVKAIGKDNAAVTVLPAHDGKILILLESENHIVRDTFEVILGQSRPLDPTDDSRDLPVEDMEAIADSVYPGTGNEGPADRILDNNAGTHWHTNYNTDEGQDVNNRWIGVKLNEAADVTGIRFLPRGGNGDVTEYKVQYRATDAGEWTDVPGATGTLARDGQNWKLITFAKINVKQIRIVGVHTYADVGNDAHMSMAEFRVVSDAITTSDTEAGIVREDYPAADMTLTAGSTHSSSSADNAKDGSTSTFWETNWGSGVDNTGKLWMQIELKEAATIDQLKYYPRYGSSASSGDQNGFVSKYRVEVSDTGEDNSWETVAEGSWTIADNWLTAQFTEAKTVKYVRLTGVETLTNGNAQTTDMTVAEIRVATVRTVDPNAVDTTILDATIAIAEAYEANDYTTVSWNEFAAALAAAKDAVAADDADQDDIDSALATLAEKTAALQKTADTKALTKKINEVKALTEADYTAASWAALQTEIAKAKAVKANRDVTADEVEEAAADLEAAIAALVDLRELKAAIVEAGEFEEANYKADSWTAFAAALNTANTMADDATQTDVDTATADLRNAMNALVPAVEVTKDQLNAKIEAAEALEAVASNYTSGSYAAVAEALAAAKALGGNALQSKVDAATKALEDAIAALVDLTGLTTVLAEAEGKTEADYTPNSWSAFETALNAAKNVKNHADATKEEVAEAEAALTAAIANLARKAEKETLKQEIESVQDRYQADKYTEESYQALMDAIEQANAVLNDSNATKAQGEAALAAIEAAINALEAKQEVCTHTWDDGVIKTEATVFNKEVRTYKCSICNETKDGEVGEKLAPTIETNAVKNKIKLQKKQTAKGFQITELAKGDSIVSIKSSNKKVVKVKKVNKANGTCTLKAGKLTGKKGKATITITLASGLKKTIKVTVQTAKVKTTKISGLEKTMTLNKGKKQTLKPVLVPFTSQDKVKFTSSNPKVVKVTSKGKITAKKKGKATIKVKAGKKTFKVKVTVK